MRHAQQAGQRTGAGRFVETRFFHRASDQEPTAGTRHHVDVPAPRHMAQEQRVALERQHVSLDRADRRGRETGSANGSSPAPGGVHDLASRNPIVLQSNPAGTAAIALDFEHRVPQDEFHAAQAAALHQSLHQKPVVNLVIARQKERSGKRRELRLALPKLRGGHLLNGNTVTALPCQGVAPGLPFAVIGKKGQRANGAVLAIDAGLGGKVRRRLLVEFEAGAAEREDRTFSYRLGGGSEHAGRSPRSFLAGRAAFGHGHAHALPGQQPRQCAANDSSANDHYVIGRHCDSIICRREQ